MDITKVRRWWRPVAAVSLVICLALVAVGIGLAPSARTPTKAAAVSEWPWSISLHVSRTTVPRGTPIPATITVVNLTHQALVVTGCGGIEHFQMTVGNSQHPNLLAVLTDACFAKSVVTAGPHVIHTLIATTYQSCGFTGDPRCTLAPFPALPTGTYRTEIVMPDGLDIPPPAPVTIHLTP